jgi:periplasmic protein TonB
MFADSLLDSAWKQSSRRRWTTVASFTLQAVGIGVLLLIPIISTEGLPQLARVIDIPVAAPQGPPPASTLPQSRRSAPLSNFRDGMLMTPSRIPRATPRIDDRGIALLDPGLPTVPGGTGTGADPDGVLHSILRENAGLNLPPKLVVHASPRVSVMMQGHLVHRVEPIYPSVARQAGIQGAVVLRAIISKEGTIEDLRVLSGHPLLAPAALDAVRQWRYRPYLLNGEPVEVETQVTVNFVLSRG